jgi:radical SAM-linked protein
MKAQRLRFHYRLTPAALALNHRDIVNAWIAALADAGFDIAYSEGKRPAPQVSIGAPLPQGVTSDGELVDIFLARPADPAAVLDAARQHLPDGIEAASVTETSVGGPSLQSRLKWAEYEVDTPADGCTPETAEAAVRALLAADHLPFEHRKETKVKCFDLRPLVLSVCIEGASGDSIALSMRLRAEPEATARADQVVAALGLPPPSRVHRKSLHLEDVPPVIAAYRRHGEPDRV